MGPLDGVQVVEIASLAPAPFGCMVLADLGADVLRVDRADTGGPDPGRAQGPLSGGRLLMALGILAALLERERSGLGQVVDAAMVDGSALLSTFLYGLRASGAWRDERGTNLLDTGAPFYDTYRTKDGKYVAVGALE